VSSCTLGHRQPSAANDFTRVGGARDEQSNRAKPRHRAGAGARRAVAGPDLFGTSHRLGDLRRLIRQYGRDAESVFPTGDYNPLGAAAGTLYGTDVNLPVPFEETNNPKYSGCLDRAP
jgi:hypothetical protein